MKQQFRPRSVSRDSVIRPGFDVLLAVTGARQAASPTARLVAGRRGIRSGEGAGCTVLLASGRSGSNAAAPDVARFAELSMPSAPERDSDATARQEMKTPFTRAFQPMVKHVDLQGPGNADRPIGDGPGME